MNSEKMTIKNFDENDENNDKLIPLDRNEIEFLQKIPNSRTQEKVRYDKPINLTIEKIGVSRTEKPKIKDGDKYHEYRINITYSNGEKESLGGFRAYLDENDKPDRFWSTEKSAAGRIKKMLEVFLELSEPLSFYQFISNLHGQRVRVRSEDWSVMGEKGFKNLPMEFLPKE